MSLETRLKACHEAKEQLEERFDDLAEELADVEQENDILKDGTVLKRRLELITELENENQQLRQQLQTAGASVQPDYEAIRDRTLNKLKVGKQSTAGKAIDAFIKEIMHE
ncbi:hypothetical protein [Nostoc sp. LPT]|uniref:hypothetical protein n=1 Tax=Nostoc sp. LPT TaxID=2815387 RepID=UPI001D494FAA|nr:hypothetical protein [Nostoc sp. LPT]MBN4002207.1 hypothetical protein [Nostoc sp. LPT]